MPCLSPGVTFLWTRTHCLKRFEMGEYAKTYWNNGGDDGDDTNDGKASPEAYINAYIKWRELG